MPSTFQIIETGSNISSEIKQTEAIEKSWERWKCWNLILMWSYLKPKSIFSKPMTRLVGTNSGWMINSYSLRLLFSRWPDIEVLKNSQESFLIVCWIVFGLLKRSHQWSVSPPWAASVHWSHFRWQDGFDQNIKDLIEVDWCACQLGDSCFWSSHFID
jgi:hypothetical protein